MINSYNFTELILESKDMEMIKMLILNGKFIKNLKLLFNTTQKESSTLKPSIMYI